MRADKEKEGDRHTNEDTGRERTKASRERDIDIHLLETICATVSICDSNKMRADRERE